MLTRTHGRNALGVGVGEVGVREWGGVGWVGGGVFTFLLMFLGTISFQLLAFKMYLFVWRRGGLPELVRTFSFYHVGPRHWTGQQALYLLSCL